MGDRRIRSGWCIEHEAPEVFSFGDTPRWFCIQNDDEDYCIIVPLFTRQESIDSLDMEAAIERYLVCVGGPAYPLYVSRDGRAINGEKARSIVAAAFGKEQP